MKINLNKTIKTKDHDGYKAQVVHDKMWHLVAVQCDVVECMTPEGPSDDFCYHIQLINFFTNEVYQLKQVIYGHIRSETYEDEDFCEDHTWYENARIRCESLIEKMYAKGEINLDFWKKVQ